MDKQTGLFKSFVSLNDGDECCFWSHDFDVHAHLLFEEK